jgi:hypothetical protein
VLNPLYRTLVGASIGLIGLIAMIKLVGAGFPGNLLVAEIFVGLAMVPWVVYSAGRARHGRLSRRAATAVVSLAIGGLLLVWLGTVGPVLTLACSLAGFVIIWLHDLPARRRPAQRLVRVDELTTK